MSEIQKDEEQEKLWTEFCNETFRLGQLTMWIDQTQSKLQDLEKQHEVAMKKARGAADKHDKYVREKNEPSKTASPESAVQ